MDFKEIVRDLDRQIKELQKAKKALRSLSGKEGHGARGRSMSAAGRKRIAAAQRKRWAKIRAGKKR
jgi:hypothetical protein